MIQNISYTKKFTTNLILLLDHLASLYKRDLIAKAFIPSIQKDLPLDVGKKAPKIFAYLIYFYYIIVYKGSNIGNISPRRDRVAMNYIWSGDRSANVGRKDVGLSHTLYCTELSEANRWDSRWWWALIYRESILYIESKR